MLEETNIQAVVTGVVGLITTIASGWTSWFFTKRKYYSEVDSTLIKNMQDSLDFYTQLSDDNKQRLDETLKRNDLLEEEIRQLRQQVFELMNTICTDMSCALRKKQTKAKMQNKKDA